METLYIVMPAYNEEQNIYEVVRSWYPLLDGKSEKSRIVVADSGSTDRTHSFLLKMKKDYPKLVILTETQKKHGPKLMALYDYAIQHRADYIFQIDSDGQTSPEDFNAFWEQRAAYKGIFGNRIRRGDGHFRTFVEKVVCFILKIYFGVSIPDANAPFRLMQVSALKKYLYRLPKNYHLPNIMITTYYAYYHEKLLFYPISFTSRQGGRNSIHLFKIIKIGWKALGDFRILKKEMK